MCSLMFVRFIHSAVASPASVVENLVPLIFSLLLAVFVARLYKPTENDTDTAANKPKPITWSVSISALALGLSLFLFQIAVLN